MSIRRILAVGFAKLLRVVQFQNIDPEEGAVGDPGLVSALHKKLPNLKARTGGELRVLSDDAETKVNVDVTNEVVRNVLTDRVPLTNYSAIIWQAETRNIGGRLETVVQYLGPRRER